MRLMRSMMLAGAMCAAAAMALPPTCEAASTTVTPGADIRNGAYFDVDGAHIFYQEQGTGPAMLLIHGFPLSGALMERQLLGLSDKFQVITVDLPGFGLSTVPNYKQTDTSYAKDLLALLAHLGISQAIIGGHSMGGQITLKMYELDPSLFTGMILFDTNPAPASVVEKYEWPGFGAQAYLLGSKSLAPIVVPIMITGAALMRTPMLGAAITAMVAEASPLGVSGGANALVTRPNYQPLLPSISIPTLVVEGQDDPLYAYPIAERLKAAIPGAKLLILPDAGHASMFQEGTLANNGIVSWAQGAGLIQ